VTPWTLEVALFILATSATLFVLGLVLVLLVRALLRPWNKERR
jgi:hypothetical protein